MFNIKSTHVRMMVRVHTHVETSEVEKSSSLTLRIWEAGWVREQGQGLRLGQGLGLG